MAKPNFIELPGCDRIPIIYEDRSVLAIDKPRGWMLVPHSWRQTNWNLQAAIDSSLRAGDFWAYSRNLKYLRHIHRLDAETSGILLFAKSEGAMRAMGDLFESRRMEKTYLAVVEGRPRQPEWTCELPIGPDPAKFGRMRVDESPEGKESQTHFRVLMSNARFTLIEARPLTGRTHQIRLHLAESGCPIMCDELYGRVEKGFRLGLRAVRLEFVNPFTKKRVDIQAPQAGFLKEFGWVGLDSAPDKRPPAAGQPLNVRSGLAGVGGPPSKSAPRRKDDADKLPPTSL
jgi:RluA family pseudouridine synthase